MSLIFELLFASLILLASCQETSYRQIRAVSSMSANSQEETPVPPASESGPASPLKEELKRYLQNPPNSKVIYELRTAVKDEKQVAAQTVVIRGKDFKVQTEETIQDKTVATATYVIQGTYYACQKDESWTCYEFPKPPEDQAQNIQKAIEEDIDKLEVQDGGQRTILQTPTQCYVLPFKDQENEGLNGQTTYCYDERGTLLYSQTSTKDFESTLEAQSYSKEVSSQEFSLPAKAEIIQNKEETIES